MAFKYQVLATQLQAEISQGTLSGKLPTEMELCQAYRVSRQTVRRALDYLVEIGLIEKRQGSVSRIRQQARTQKNDRIAIVTTYFNDYIFPNVLQDIQAVLALKGYSTFLFSTQNEVTNERRILQDLLQKPIGGIIVEGTKTALPSPNLDLYEKLIQADIPVVFLHGTYRDLPGALCVSDDNYGGGYMLARHLISRGHTKIAGIFKSDDIQGHQRYLGFLSAMRDAGLSLPDNCICWYSTEERRYLLDYGHTDLLEHLRQFYLRDCTAVICYNDEIADRLIRYFLPKGYRIPDDLAVVSFDNSYYSDLCPVQITSLAHLVGKLGSIAAQLILDHIARKPCQSQSISWRLVKKASG